jgi:hypothetical protein
MQSPAGLVLALVVLALVCLPSASGTTAAGFLSAELNASECLGGPCPLGALLADASRDALGASIAIVEIPSLAGTLVGSLATLRRWQGFYAPARLVSLPILSTQL